MMQRQTVTGEARRQPASSREVLRFCCAAFHRFVHTAAPLFLHVYGYSFGICLVAMIRGEKDVMEFYFQSLRKYMKRKSMKGVGITILNNRMYSKGWRPLLPVEFEKSYPKLCKLLKRCWSQKKEERPGFDEIVRVMQGDVADEVRREEEPEITVYSVEDDAIFHERMGKDEHFEEEEGTAGRTRSVMSKEKYDAVMKEMKQMVSRHEYDRVVGELHELQGEKKEEPREEITEKKQEM